MWASGSPIRSGGEEKAWLEKGVLHFGLSSGSCLVLVHHFNSGGVLGGSFPTMRKGLTHCGWNLYWLGSPGPYKKGAEQAVGTGQQTAALHGFYYSSCRQVPALASTDGLQAKQH